MKLKTIILLIAISTMLSSCVYKIGGAEIYDVKSEDSLTQKEIKKYNIKFITETNELFWADVSRKNGFYAINVYEDDGKIHYSKLKKSYVEELKIEPNFGFWSEYGRYITIPLTILIVIFSIASFFNAILK